MPTARLPDVNTSIIRYRGEALNAILRRDATAALMALHAINAMLPDEVDHKTNLPRFRVVINDAIYRDRTKHTYVVLCPNPKCDATVNRAELKLRTIRPPFAARVLTGLLTLTVWRCLKCGRDARLDQCDVEDRHASEPHYCGVVPRPPRRRPGLRGRTTFALEFAAWATVFVAELEAKLAEYRDVHWVKSDEAEYGYDGEGGEGGAE